MVAALLNENNRLGEFMKIGTTFEELVAAARGEVLATITTAEVIHIVHLIQIDSLYHPVLENSLMSS